MKVKYIGIAGMTALILAACENSDYELENLVPDEYHKVLYINNSGTQDLTLYNTGQANTFAISVFKGGSDPSLTASATIAIHSQEAVDSLYSEHDGANYRIIPDGSYSLDQTQINFTSSEERYKIVTLSLQTDPIEAAMEANPDVVYVLPLYLYSEQDSVNSARRPSMLASGWIRTTVGRSNASLLPIRIMWIRTMRLTIPLTSCCRRAAIRSRAS